MLLFNGSFFLFNILYCEKNKQVWAPYRIFQFLNLETATGLLLPFSYPYEELGAGKEDLRTDLGSSCVRRIYS